MGWVMEFCKSSNFPDVGIYTCNLFNLDPVNFIHKKHGPFYNQISF